MRCCDVSFLVKLCDIMFSHTTITLNSKALESPDQMSHVVRKPAFGICESKDDDQLRGNDEADQRLCFRYIDSTNPLLPKSEISSL